MSCGPSTSNSSGGGDDPKRPTLEELKELGRKKRPSSSKLKKMSDETLGKLFQRNWQKWTSTQNTAFTYSVSKQDIPECFRNLQTIKLYRVLEPNEEKDTDDSEIEGVTKPSYSIGLTGTSQGLRCLDYGFPSISYVVQGARFWVSIAPSSNAALEKLLGNKADREIRSGCLGGEFVLDLSALKKEGIEYYTGILRENQVGICFAGSYYFWVNLIDYTEVITVYTTDDVWFEMARKRETDRCSCRKTFTLNWEKMNVERKLKAAECEDSDNSEDPEGEETPSVSASRTENSQNTVSKFEEVKAVKSKDKRRNKVRRANKRKVKVAETDTECQDVDPQFQPQVMTTESGDSKPATTSGSHLGEDFDKMVIN